MRGAFYPTVLTLIALSGALFCYLCGQRGFFALDQSIVFDGAHRILSGQLPYRDFVAPHGMGLYAAQALMFMLTGVTYSGYLFFGALQNLLAVLVSSTTVRRLFPLHPGPALLTGLVTAVWFYPPSGTPYPEQSAMLLVLCAIALSIPGLSPHRGPWRLVGAGILLIGAALVKQNVTLLSLPLILGLLLVQLSGGPREFARRIGALAFGSLLGMAPVFLYLWTSESLFAFWQFSIALPAALARARLGHSSSEFADSHALFMIVAVLALVMVIMRMFTRTPSRNQDRPGLWHFLRVNVRQRASAAVMLGGFLLFSLLMRETTFNNPALSSLNLGLVLGLSWGIWRSLEIRLVALESLIVAVVTILAVLLGAMFSWFRLSQESVAWASFPRPLAIRGYEALRWGEPTMIENMPIRSEDVEELVTYLRKQHGPFFVFPDHTILYSMVGQASPQPLLWFHRGLTYQRTPPQDLDRQIVNALRQAGIQRIVREEASFLNTPLRLEGLPELHRFIDTCFDTRERFGIFSVLERASEPRAECE